MIRLEMRNYNMTSTEKHHTILALSSGKIDRYDKYKNDKYKYLKGEEMLPFDQKRVIEKFRFTNTPLRKALEKQAQIKEKNK